MQKVHTPLEHVAPSLALQHSDEFTHGALDGAHKISVLVVVAVLVTVVVETFRLQSVK
jgi:hypothetical protein